MSPSRLPSKLPRLVRRNLQMMLRLICVTALPLSAQYIPNQSAPAPSAPPTKDQAVIGTYNFKTDGKATPRGAPIQKARGSKKSTAIHNTPSVMVTTSTQVTQYFRDGRPPQVTDQVRSSDVDELNAQLVIRQWQGANWSAPYAGSITVQNEHPAYITPQGKKWLTIEANWDTQPSQ